MLLQGRKALAEFDYERSEALYRRALEASQGGLEPAVALLEILIEHLAAYEETLALSESFSPSTLKDKWVKIRLAIAYARLDRIESALATIQRVVEPEAGEVYYLAAKHFIGQQDEKQALDQMAPLKACGSVELVPAIEQLEKEIHDLQAMRLAPLEARMLRSWQEGAMEEASGLAQRLLSLMPENKAARRILRDQENKARQERIAHLLRLAGEARVRQDFDREADWLRQILDMGEDTPRIQQLFTEAREQAIRLRETAQIDAVVADWSGGEREKALLSYAQMEAPQRERIRERIQDPHFAWMEQALSPSMAVKSLKPAQAVLALGQCADAAHSGADLRQAIARLRIHEKILQSIPQARDILRRAEIRLRILEEENIKELLEQAEAFLASQDLHKVEERIEQLKGMDLEQAHGERLDTIKKQFFHYRKIQLLRKRYEESVGRGDEVTGRILAGRLSRLLEGGPAELWADKAAAHTAAIRRQWCLSSADLSGLPGCYGSLGLNPLSDDGSCLLLSGGRQVLVVTGHDRWVFFRTFDLNERRFHRGYLLQAPRPLHSVMATVDGETVWVYDLKGLVLQVRLDPLDILFWQDVGALLGEEEEYEDTLLCPQSRLLWLRKSVTESWNDNFEIVHIDQGRSVRTIRSTGFPVRIDAGGEFRTVLADLSSSTVRIHSDDGKVLKKSDWPRVMESLQGLPREGMDDGSARHLCHLLGIGYFIGGQVEKALDMWKEGLAYEDGRCELEPYIDYARAALLPPESRSAPSAQSPAARMLGIFEQVDRYLAQGRWKETITAVESSYPLTHTNRLMPARLAEAYLQVACRNGEMRWACKVLALAHFLERFKASYRNDPVLPPGMENWPESRLEETARKAEHWLEQSAPPLGSQ